MSIEFTGVDFRSSPISIGLYSDGTPMVKTEQFADIAVKAHTMILRAESMAEFMTAMFLYDSLTWNYSRFMKLVLPYIPGARQDRSNSTGDVLFTAHSVAREINARPFSSVIVLDPHSPVSVSAIEGAVEYPLDRVAKRLWQGYGGIIAPDKGAKNRAEQFANAMGKDIVYASKTRDVSTGALSGFEVDVTPGMHYLVVDDICDGGGTFVGLGEKIHEGGAYADLFVTHGLFTKGTGELHKYYKNITTTDSLQRDVSGVLRCKVVEDMETYE